MQSMTPATEHAILTITPSQELEFERAFETAKSIIAAMPGFQQLTLSRGVESPSQYLLLVQWDSVEHFVEVLRATP
jgi:heme-degrading monooxygenase HmoA